MSDLKSLTTKEVARLCRVSDATVKRWEDAGLLRSERTNGGHRRFRVEEIARFQRENGLGLKQCHSDDSVTRAATRRRSNQNLSLSSLFHALVAGQEEDAAHILINAFLRGEPLPELFDKAVTQAMRHIGDLWMSGEISVAQEHLASRTIINAIQKLRAVVPVPNMTGNLAFLCAVENDFHELATHLAQIVLESAGWEVLNFCTNTPLYSLTNEVLQHSPRIICISASMIHDLDRITRDYKEFRTNISKSNAAVVLGGRGFGDERIRQRFAAELYAQSFSDLLNFVQKLDSTI
jgi:excisionase family DNA binding protein